MIQLEKMMVARGRIKGHENHPVYFKNQVSGEAPQLGVWVEAEFGADVG